MRKKRMVVSGEKKVEVLEDDGGRWADMNHEILALILVTIPVDEIVRTVSLVCKDGSWRDIDVAEWCRRHHKMCGASVDIAVLKLTRWSKNRFHRLSVCGLGNPVFISVAIRGRCLTLLQMLMSSITDEIVLNRIKSLPNLKEFDISNCFNITAKGLEAFGNHCKSLVYLKRNIDPKRSWGNIFVPSLDDSEAKIIANTMLNLQSLEVRYGSFGNDGLSEILTKSKLLNRLDIHGSFHVKLEGDIKKSLERINFTDSEYGYESEDSLQFGFVSEILELLSQ